MSWNMLKKNGNSYLILDDYGTDGGVTKAVTFWLECIPNEYKILHNKYLIIIQKLYYGV